MEQHLRRVALESGLVNIKCGSTLTGILEEKDSVVTTYKASHGTYQVKGKFLVGADGKTGYTRKKYLEPRGILMEESDACKYNATWIALNLQITLPTENSHPSFPLWKLGFSQEDIYDEFFPTEFRFLCNPARPAVCGRFGLRDARLWRFEFVVKADEGGTDMAQWENARKIILPYLTHSGKRYRYVLTQTSR